MLVYNLQFINVKGLQLWRIGFRVPLADIDS